MQAWLQEAAPPSPEVLPLSLSGRCPKVCLKFGSQESLQAVRTWGAIDKQQRCIRLRSPRDHVGHEVQVPRGVQQRDIAAGGLKAGCRDVHGDACSPEASEFARLAQTAYSP